MVDEDSFLELLDTYMDMVEKQDEIIHRLSRMLAKMATDLKQYKSLHGFLDLSPENGREDKIETGILIDCLKDYEGMTSI